MALETLLRRFVIGGLFLVPFIPLIVVNEFFFPFITGKNFAFRILVELLFGAWLVLAFLKSEYRPFRSWLLYALSMLLGVMLVADALSPNSFKSFWSNFERMEGGIGLIHLVAYFVVAISFLREQKLWNRLAYTSIGASLIMSIYALLQFAGSFEIHQGGLRIDATLGNATYFAAYMLFHAFFSFIVATKAWEGKRMVWAWVFASIGMLETTLVFLSATRGTTLGLIGGLLVAGLVVVFFGKQVHASVRRGAVIGLIALAIFVGGFVALKDQPFIKDSLIFGRLAAISLEEGTTRFTIWGMAAEGFMERPVLGWGQESFNYIFNKYYKASLYGQEPWFDRAHNVFLDWLTAGGILGLSAYLSLFGIALWYLLFRKEQPLSIAERALITGLLGGYFFHNLFVFDNLTSSLLFVSLLGYIAYRYEGTRASVPFVTLPRNVVMMAAFPVIIIAVAGAVYFVNVPGMQTAYALIQTLSSQKEGIPGNLAWAKQALAYEALGRQEVREHLTQISFRVKQEQLAEEGITAEFLDLARKGLEQEVARVPDDARLRIFLGSFLRQTGALDVAGEHLAKAFELSPQKQYIRFEIGLLFFQKGDLANALAVFEETYRLDTRFDLARIYYAVTAMYAGQQDLGDSLLTERFGSPIVDNDYVLQAYIDLKQADRVVAIAEKRVADSPQDITKRMQLATVYREVGRIAEAVAVARSIAEIDPSLSQAVEGFIQGLGQ